MAMNERLGVNPIRRGRGPNAEKFHRISKIQIKGFKNPDRHVTFEFSKGQTTIVFGENGSGKTTLLRVIQAALKGDISALQMENISYLEIEIESVNKTIYKWLYKSESKGKVMRSLAMPPDNNSILFGTNRGLIGANSIFFENINERLILLKSKKNTLTQDSQEILDSLIEDTSFQDITAEEYLLTEHLSIDDLQVDTIEKALRITFDKGQKALLKGMNNAFFSTIDNAINISEKIDFPENFQEKFKLRKDFFLSFIQSLDESKTKNRIKDFIESETYDLENENTVFKALLVNLLLKTEQDERENLDLKAINTIVETFNSFVIHNKKLIINSVETFIQLPNGSRHKLKDLSSGERHLLSFLTLFLILGRNRKVFLIDEPEISMSIKWQRKLLALLSEFSPHAQIIVATHSPEIADGHTEYLKELV
ncbi:AAA family ATPase [Haliscomenobacter sp.]|uniref:AAA family ATPase n=1 Tax=Haliscomenobacter sp. TaxID=2717303 RepID=UPI003593C6FD